jgi:hypothetical protein
MSQPIPVASLQKLSIEMPLPVITLIGIAWSEYDVNAPVRGWGREYLGHGVSVGLDLYTVGQATVELADGSKLPCVVLQIQRRFHTGAPEAPSQVFFPFEGLRECSLEALVAEAR